MTQVGWDRPWDLAYEFYKREGLDIKDLAKLFGVAPVVMRQWVVARPCPARPLAERAAMLRKMGVKWDTAAKLLGFRADYLLRAELGNVVRTGTKDMRRWQRDYRAELKEIRKKHNRA